MSCDKKMKRRPVAIQTAFAFGRIRRFLTLHPRPTIGVDHLHFVEIGEVERGKYAIASEGAYRVPFADPGWLKLAGARTCAERLLVSRPLHCQWVAGRIVCVHGLWLLDLVLEILPSDAKVQVFLHAKRVTRKEIDELNASDLLETAASVPAAGHVKELWEALKYAMRRSPTKDLFRAISEEKLKRLVGGRSRNAFRPDKDKD